MLPLYLCYSFELIYLFFPKNESEYSPAIPTNA